MVTLGNAIQDHDADEEAGLGSVDSIEVNVNRVVEDDSIDDRSCGSTHNEEVAMLIENLWKDTQTTLKEHHASVVASLKSWGLRQDRHV